MEISVTSKVAMFSPHKNATIVVSNGFRKNDIYFALFSKAPLLPRTPILAKYSCSGKNPNTGQNPNSGKNPNSGHVFDSTKIPQLRIRN